ncbi:TIGR02285 family protein [Desulfogranum japonicum]|uniref:TIGR02285 family protein n=1 Tax=Desulfogranum japonicum TaxID=231447 RepID=UPI0003F991D0|nr:TIGR02285 family protein [Desulfogranum japonicum]
MIFLRSPFVTWHRLPVFLCILLIFTAHAALAGEKIYWMEADAPPFFIHEGKYKGQGYEDQITAIVKQYLPQYEHIHIVANISRHYRQWQDGEPACSLAMYKTPEREEFAFFSIPSMLTLPPVLIIRKDHFKYFGGKKVVNLTKVLKEAQHLIGRPEHRSYGNTIDTILNTYGNSRNIYSYEGSQLSLNMFKMLIAGRIDALPGLPEEAMYLAETLDLRDQIMTLTIEENQNEYDAMLTYVACSKNAWGKKVISEINEVLRAQRPSEQYRSTYERWLDESSLEGFRKLYENVFLKITQ